MKKYPIRTEEKMMKQSKKFGDFSPYYTSFENKLFFANTFKELYQKLPGKWELDISAVLSLINFNYILGDRTLVKNVYRFPWHSEIENNNIKRNPPIPHYNEIEPPYQIAQKLIQLLEEEFITEFSSYPIIWNLQTGGLDSRVTLGIINKLKKEGKLNSEIKLITWGAENSRDVHYGKKLAKIYNYEFYHIPIEPEILKKNTEIAVEHGAAEVSAFHYHAMDRIKEIVDKNDLVIASSFGDSIGRAEFSGSHLSNLTLRPIKNAYWLFNEKIFDQHKNFLEKDRSLAWITDREQSKNTRNELDMQENYMRRMLVHTMDHIRSFTNLKQTFTYEKIVSQMFSYSPSCRNFDTYYHALKILDPKLMDIPWARTGVDLHNQNIDDNQRLSKEYNSYNDWFLKDFFEQAKDVLLSGKLVYNSILHKGNVEHLLNIWQTNSRYSQIVSKMYQIELLIDKFDLKVENQPEVIIPVNDNRRFKRYYNKIVSKLLIK